MRLIEGNRMIDVDEAIQMIARYISWIQRNEHVYKDAESVIFGLTLALEQLTKVKTTYGLKENKTEE